MTPMAREAANAARSAFGPDYEARLRQEAGPQPEKLARRKHQISSLYHQAKMKVQRDARPGCVHAHVDNLTLWSMDDAMDRSTTPNNLHMMTWPASAVSVS